MPWYFFYRAYANDWFIIYIIIDKSESYFEEKEELKSLRTRNFKINGHTVVDLRFGVTFLLAKDTVAPQVCDGNDCSVAVGRLLRTLALQRSLSQ